MSSADEETTSARGAHDAETHRRWVGATHRTAASDQPTRL